MKTKFFYIFAAAALVSVACDDKNDGTDKGPTHAECPAGEVKVATSTGTLIWAGSNLTDYQTFAENPTDAGCLFQWGYNDALERASGTDTPWKTEASEATEWNPCPKGWRLPTKQEVMDLIGASAASSEAAVMDGTYTTLAIVTESNKGLEATPKSGDTTKVLHLTMSGQRGNSNGNYLYPDVRGYYWSSTVDGTAVSNLYFRDSGTCAMQNVNKLAGCSVRCVR